jgi:hypothetical protein
VTAAARNSPGTRLITAARPSPLAVFIARAEARALLWQAGEFDLAEAVDALQASAVRDGLIADLGQDAVQEIMSKAFGVVR